MVEQALPMLGILGVPEKRIDYDKFPTTGDPGDKYGEMEERQACREPPGRDIGLNAQRKGETS